MNANDVFLTKKELAARWKCSEFTLDERVREGTLKPCRNLPGWKVRLADILKLEESPIEPMSPLERRRLLRRIESLETENAKLRRNLMQVAVLSAEFMKDEAGGAA